MAPLILFDTDVVIDYLRGHAEAQTELLGLPVGQRAVSAVTVMEVLVGARDRGELAVLESFVDRAFGTVAEIDEATSRLARSLVAGFGLSHGLRIPDALIAATARQRGWRLLTGNVRHFAFVPELDVAAPAYRQARP